MNQNDKNKIRCRVANMIKRHNIDTKCVICGEPGSIVHNFTKPYFITFACSKCRSESFNTEKIENSRFNVMKQLEEGINNNKFNQHMNNLSKKNVTRIVVSFMNSITTIADYCKVEGISRHQFNTILSRYAEYYPNQPIYDMIQNRSQRIRKARIAKTKFEQSLL